MSKSGWQSDLHGKMNLNLGRGSAVKIFPQTISELMNQLISDMAVYRTAPATPGLLKRRRKKVYRPMEFDLKISTSVNI